MLHYNVKIVEKNDVPEILKQDFEFVRLNVECVYNNNTLKSTLTDTPKEDNIRYQHILTLNDYYKDVALDRDEYRIVIHDKPSYLNKYYTFHTVHGVRTDDVIYVFTSKTQYKMFKKQYEEMYRQPLNHQTITDIPHSSIVYNNPSSLVNAYLVVDAYLNDIFSVSCFIENLTKLTPYITHDDKIGTRIEVTDAIARSDIELQSFSIQSCEQLIKYLSFNQMQSVKKKHRPMLEYGNSFNEHTENNSKLIRQMALLGNPNISVSTEHIDGALIRKPATSEPHYNDVEHHVEGNPRRTWYVKNNCQLISYDDWHNSNAVLKNGEKIIGHYDDVKAFIEEIATTKAIQSLSSQYYSDIIYTITSIIDDMVVVEITEFQRHNARKDSTTIALFSNMYLVGQDDVYSMNDLVNTHRNIVTDLIRTRLLSTQERKLDHSHMQTILETI